MLMALSLTVACGGVKQAQKPDGGDAEDGTEQGAETRASAQAQTRGQGDPERVLASIVIEKGPIRAHLLEKDEDLEIRWRKPEGNEYPFQGLVQACLKELNSEDRSKAKPDAITLRTENQEEGLFGKTWSFKSLRVKLGESEKSIRPAGKLKVDSWGNWEFETLNFEFEQTEKDKGLLKLTADSFGNASEFTFKQVEPGKGEIPPGLIYEIDLIGSK